MVSLEKNPESEDEEEEKLDLEPGEKVGEAT